MFAVHLTNCVVTIYSHLVHDNVGVCYCRWVQLVYIVYRGICTLLEAAFASGYLQHLFIKVFRKFSVNLFNHVCTWLTLYFPTRFPPLYFMIFFRFDETNGNYDDLRRSLSSDDGFPPGPLGLRERLGPKFPFPPGIFFNSHILLE